MDYKIYIGVDVGSESLRVGAFNDNGKLIIKSSRSITVVNPLPNYYEQSSEEIWNMFLEAFQEILFRLKYVKICGLGFATTCSLVTLDHHNAPIAIRDGAPDSCNIIMWMDHRAIEEARSINAIWDEVLNCLGGSISVEMQIPKILWLKKNLARWSDVGTLMDLSDYMRWKATGSLSRSLCPATCKWNYRGAPDQGTWPLEFYDKIGLGPELGSMLDRTSPYALDDRDLLKANGIFDKEILRTIASPQRNDWINSDIVVGPSLIDAHAGALGLLACRCSGDGQNSEMRKFYDSPKEWESLNCKMALMTGTSNCLMATSDIPINVPGVWGPYNSVIFPGKYLSEGGQSASGQAMSYVINRFFDKKNVRQRKFSCPHLPSPHVFKNPHEAMLSTLLAMGHPKPSYKEGQALPLDIGERMFGSRQSAVPFFDLTRHLHVLPDFNGNRSPLADPTMLGTIVGLNLDESMTGAARLYLATLQSLALGVRRIISAMNAAGHSIKYIHTGGGVCANNLFPKIVADATGLPVVLPDNRNNCVMLGAAIYASYTSDSTLKSVQEAMESMFCGCEFINPSAFAKSFYDEKYQVFLQLSDDQIKYRHIMETDN